MRLPAVPRSVSMLEGRFERARRPAGRRTRRRGSGSRSASRARLVRRRRARRMFASCASCASRKLVVGHRRARDADDGEARGQQPGDASGCRARAGACACVRSPAAPKMTTVHGRRAAAGARQRVLSVRGGRSHGSSSLVAGRSTWPPNSLRMAERSSRRRCGPGASGSGRRAPRTSTSAGTLSSIAAMTVQRPSPESCDAAGVAGERRVLGERAARSGRAARSETTLPRRQTSAMSRERRGRSAAPRQVSEPALRRMSKPSA